MPVVKEVFLPLVLATPRLVTDLGRENWQASVYIFIPEFFILLFLYVHGEQHYNFTVRSIHNFMFLSLKKYLKDVFCGLKSMPHMVMRI